jgi:hypothetical protein
MKYVKVFLLLALFVMSVSAVGAQTQNISISQPLQPLPVDPGMDSHINKITAKIDDAAGAEVIMGNLLRDDHSNLASSLPASDQPFEDKDFYCIIHILRWSAPAANGSQTIQAQNWYLYSHHNLTLGNPTTIPRLYGAKNITLLYLHLSKQTNYDPLYEVEITKKTPVYVSHFLGLAGLFSSLTGPAAAAVNNDYWAAYSFNVRYKVSDISVTPKVTREATGAVEEAGVAQKFDNEGKYLADFSVGVPIRRISQLNFDSTNNTVTAKEVDKTDILALANIYPRPIDIRSNNADWMPHFVGGVAIAKQPLHKIFVGTGFGPLIANFYIGALFVKREQLSTLKPGDLATPAQLSNDLRRSYKTQVAFGLNVPVGAIIEKLKK